MNRIFIIVTFLISGLTVSYAQKTLQERAMDLISDPAFVNALVGIKAVTGSGDTLVKVNSDKLLVPASNMKLVSTGNALVKLGADFRYRTDLAHDGVISDGILHGNLYIVGNGDPLTGSKDSIATPLESTFREWENIVRKAGIRHSPYQLYCLKPFGCFKIKTSAVGTNAAARFFKAFAHRLGLILIHLAAQRMEGYRLICDHENS